MFRKAKALLLNRITVCLVFLLIYVAHLDVRIGRSDPYNLSKKVIPNSIIAMDKGGHSFDTQ
jgi:hypothetical protein